MPSCSFFGRSYVSHRGTAGKIDFTELKAALAGMGRHPSDQDLQRIMIEADTDQNGELDFPEVRSSDRGEKGRMSERVRETGIK